MGVTIGLPFYNCERTLVRTLRSIFAQTYQDWELILVDDGSRDRSLEIASAVRDPRVRLVADRGNRGLAARLNQITQLARNEYVCRMDGDDLAHPQRVAAQRSYLEQHPEVDVLGTAAIAIDDQDRPSLLRGARANLRDPREVLRFGGPIHPSVMARRAWLRRFPYDPSFARSQDKELWVRSCGSSRFEQLSQPLFFYREGGQVSLGNYRGSCEADRRILLRYGPNLVGPLETARLVARSHLKETCYRVFDLAGQAGRLVARRGSDLTGEELAAARETVAKVLQTPVPGID